MAFSGGFYKAGDMKYLFERIHLKNLDKWRNRENTPCFFKIQMLSGRPAVCNL